MEKLQPSDQHRLNAANGWLELGNIGEALAELKALTPAAAQHPDALETQWHIYAVAKQWEAALETARQLIQAAPGRATGWIDQSYCLHELRRTQEAWSRLLAVAEKFPRVSTIPYNLACYACQLGRLEEARTRLAQAIDVGAKKDIRKMALRDQDLKPLWEEIAGM